MGQYAEFENLCLVDTLDNTGFNWIGKQGDLFGVSAENAQRIKKQNERKISVIIGNPPYNANQQNENDNNKNREYAAIDKRIKETYIKNSTAQKTKLYDMYSRFYRWAMDRLNENGVIAFITNRSFVDSRTFDGFRKSIQLDFDFAYIIDTKSDVRANPKIAGTTHNVFGIQTGVAILFLVKTSTGQLKQHNCKIQYVAMEDEWRKEDKLHWLTEHPFEKIDFDNIAPDKNNNWINLSLNDWDALIPVADKEVKNGKKIEALFNSFSLGVATNRDEWVYDFNRLELSEKVKFFSNFYNSEIDRWNKEGKGAKVNDFVNRDIKWTTELESYLIKNRKLQYQERKIKDGAYRCFVKSYFYFDKVIIHRPYLNDQYFGLEEKYSNQVIAVNTNGKDFNVLATNLIPNNHFNGDSQVMPLYRYQNGERLDNITDWGVEQFNQHYKSKGDSNSHTPITREEIFHYIYAVLHHPAYRKKYELNLKREFPRIPLYDDFYQWAAWGAQLMQLHIEYEIATPFDLKRQDVVIDLPAGAKLEALSKAKLKADKAAGSIELDAFTTLSGIPSIAWEYKLGNRSALEWILDQYKEKKPSDPTIAEKFNTYKFADYKEQVIDLLKRVCTVSVETMKIVNAMP